MGKRRHGCQIAGDLISGPKAFSVDELDGMIRGIRAPKLLDWFITNIVKPSKHAEELRQRWKDEADLVGRAGWSLTTDRVIKDFSGLDIGWFLDQIEREMKQAAKQWSMNIALPKSAS